MIKAFISHSSKDKKFVRTLKDDLNENGIETWVDEDQLDLGDSLVEKLEASLEETSHFILILSPNSVNSDWVRFELNKAISQVTNKLMHKIIPIKYRDCDIPKELEGLLYADLSKEIVRVVNNKIEFTTEGYIPFLNKIIKTLYTPADKKLTNQDKVKLKEEFRNNDSITTNTRDHFATLLLQVEGYITQEGRNKFIEKVKEESSTSDKEIHPVILPRIIKNVFKDIKIGDRIKLTTDTKSYKIAHFAGFRRDDFKITVDPIMRKRIGIIKQKKYAVRFDANNYTLYFSNEE